MKRELSIGIKLTLINFPSMIQLQSLDLLFSHLTGLVELISDETGMDHSETVKHFKLTMQFFNNEIPQIYVTAILRIFYWEKSYWLRQHHTPATRIYILIFPTSSREAFHDVLTKLPIAGIYWAKLGTEIMNYNEFCVGASKFDEPAKYFESFLVRQIVEVKKRQKVENDGEALIKFRLF